MLIAWSGLVLLQTGPRQVLLPFVIHHDLSGDARDYGTLLAVFGVFAIVGSLILASRQLPRNYPVGLGKSSPQVKRLTGTR